MADAAPQYLTTREVADLLRVKERKVYDLAAAGEIPHRRITGKLLFPRAELLAWIDGDGERASAERPPVLTGSHDPLLDWAVRESGAGMATLFNGSAGGLETFIAGEASVAGLHLPDREGWNIRAVSRRGLTGCVLIGWAVRARGLILSPGLAGARELGDLRGKRLVRRQPGAGAAELLEILLDQAGLGQTDFAAGGLARTESDAAAAVATGEADATLGLQAMAGQFDLPFKPLVDERFDLLIDRRAYFTPPVQTLMAFAATGAVRAKAAQMGGYDLAGLGAVRWLSP